MIRVKNKQSRSPSDPFGPWGEVKLRYVYYKIKWGEAKPSVLKLTSVFHHLHWVGPKQLCALTHLGCTREAGISYFNKSRLHQSEQVCDYYPI